MEKVTLAIHARILHELYNNVINMFDIPELFCSTEITDEQRKKFEECKISDEEIWAYSNESKLSIGYNKDDRNIIEIIRNVPVRKRTFFNTVVEPTYKMATKKYFGFVYNSELDQFAIENKLGKDIFEEFDKWMKTNPEELSIEDAQRLVQNIKNFWATKKDY